MTPKFCPAALWVLAAVTFSFSFFPLPAAHAGEESAAKQEESPFDPLDKQIDENKRKIEELLQPKPVQKSDAQSECEACKQAGAGKKCDSCSKKEQASGAAAGAGDSQFQPLVDEISGNMKKIEELLDQGNTGSDVQKLQNNTSQRMKELIEKLQAQ